MWRLSHCFLSLGLLLLFGAYLAWETRKVHILALNDSKLIGLSLYNVIIPCILVIPILGVVADQPTIHFSLSSFLTIFCTSFTLSLVFVPKVSLPAEQFLRTKLQVVPWTRLLLYPLRSTDKSIPLDTYRKHLYGKFSCRVRARHKRC